jgi:carboxylesterase
LHESSVIQPSEFFLEGDRRGVLLIHGLTGTPMEMRLLGKGLNNAGYTVHGMQLAGHCGNVEDLLATGWRDWYASVERAAHELAGKVDHLFVGGLSMGALLALKLAADHPKMVAGVGVYGATFRYDGWNIPWKAKLSFLLPLFKRLGIGRNRMFDEEPPYGLRDERIRAQISAAMLGGDSAAAGLPGNPWYSLADPPGERADRAAAAEEQLPHDHHRPRTPHADREVRRVLRRHRQRAGRARGSLTCLPSSSACGCSTSCWTPAASSPSRRRPATRTRATAWRAGAT